MGGFIIPGPMHGRPMRLDRLIDLLTEVRDRHGVPGETQVIMVVNENRDHVHEVVVTARRGNVRGVEIR